MIRPFRFMFVICAIVFCVSAVSSAEGLFTPDMKAAENWSAGHAYILLGKYYDYETGYGRVDVRSDGTMSRISARLGDSDIGYTHFNFNVDSYFAGDIVGAADLQANLFSVRALFPFFPLGRERDNRRPEIGIRYQFLDNAIGKSVPGIHFVDLFGSASLGSIEIAGGLTSYFGNETDTEFGVFANATYSAADNVDLFAEYSSLDFMKVFQDRFVAPAAENVGVIDTSNAPRDAFSFGVRMRYEGGLALKFAVYDLEHQMKPFIEGSFSR